MKLIDKLFGKLYDALPGKYKNQPIMLTEEVKTIDTRITDVSNKHAVYQWHNDIYMDLNGNTYEVKRCNYNKPEAEIKKEAILNSPDID